MTKRIKILTVFEHQIVRQGSGEQQLSAAELTALQQHHGDKGVKYYSLIHRGVKFNQYVGVLQVGRRLIEVLPKADKGDDEGSWRKRLIDMLRVTGTLQVENPSSSQLKIKPNSVLDLYFELLIIEMEQLLHRGLIKQYRQTTGNRNALKGSLQFAQHLNHNLVHRERFYVRHTTYDRKHLLHQILYEALLLLERLNTHPQLQHRIGRLILDWPPQDRLKVYPTLFERLSLNRKTAPYRNALQIAKMLLLNYHPDVSRGQEDVLALMFDMNQLWERFVFVSLRRHVPNGATVHAQNKKTFWSSSQAPTRTMRPDILLQFADRTIVLDTKWKRPNGYGPSPDDLRQLYVYLKYYGAEQAALVYPGARAPLLGHFKALPGKEDAPQGSLLFLPVNNDLSGWQKAIAKQICQWSYGDQFRYFKY
jgi:5-methylcytosine-specific restriction enzyme subunit McrC